MTRVAMATILALCVTSCAHITGYTEEFLHEEFTHRMSFMVGVHISETVFGRRSAQARVALPNGNTEVGHIYSQSKVMQAKVGVCLVFFELDQETGVIVGWRFEGTRKACLHVPI